MEFPRTNTTYFNTDFCLSMTNRVLLKQVELGSNFLSSPLSFHVMLSFIAAGSAGHTLEQLLSFMGTTNIGELNYLASQIITLTSLVEGSKIEKLLYAIGPKHIRTCLLPDKIRKDSIRGPTLFFVNGVWVEQSFRLKPSFEEISRDVYKAKTNVADFSNKADEVRHEVNSWAEEATKGLIREILPSGSIDSNMALILANALYFKGAWNQMFDVSKTKNRDFHLLDGKVVQVPFMTGESDDEHHYRSFDGYKVLRLPYQSDRETTQFSMYFFLPDKKDGLPNLVKMFNSKPAGFFNQDFNLQQEELPDFWIPKFKFSFELEASETLKEMGLEQLFYSGELKEMVNSSNSEQLCLSKIFQKSYIEVNEEGTEAAASNIASARWLCAQYPTPSFVAEHPFMFMIREDATRTVFFTGVVLNPLLLS